MMCMVMKAISLAVCCAVISLEATVTVHNETGKPIYAGIYYYLPQGTARLETKVVSMAVGQEVELQEPPYHF